MDEIRLPRHVVKRIERRRAGRFGKTQESPQGLKRVLSSPSPEFLDPLRSLKVQRLLQGSLRPPTADKTPLFSRAES
jgi:hypothetical protein